MEEEESVTARAATSAEDLEGSVDSIVQSCPNVVLEIGMFFDGTLNNMYNVRARDRADSSYQNALSNVVLLHDRYRQDTVKHEHCAGDARRFGRLYVEGAGSTRGQGDTFTGYATGMGETGVEARVLDGFRRMLALVGRLRRGDPVQKVVLDVFGFSRGAAAARYFVNCVRAGTVTYNPWGPGNFTETLPEDIPFEIRFVGVFDTVAAIGDAADDDNDPVNVHVRADQAARIHHLTAGDEYRVNFRLNRTLPQGGTVQEMPGAHSDVGGGYRDPGQTTELTLADSDTYPTRAEAEAARQRTIRTGDANRGLIERDWREEGWLRRDEAAGGARLVVSEIQEVTRGGRTRYGFDSQWVLERPWVKVGLSRIPLHIMHREAVSSGAGLGALPRDDENYVVPPGLQDAFGILWAGGQLTPAQNAEVLRDYGHISAKMGTVADRAAHGPEVNHRRVEYDNVPSRAI